MANPISSVSSSPHPQQAAQPAFRAPQPTKQPSPPVQDKVTLSKTKDVDHDGDSK
jgi:hypothetical protein